jgi:5-methylcytosine-specific restriction endonuclease McrBC GTP-binding regulatory subunit McrB
MIPENVTKERIIEALQEIDESGLRNPSATSSKFDLIYNGKKYPPKHVVFIANELAKNPPLPYGFTTETSQRHLKKLSPEFIIRPKESDTFSELIIRYKKHLLTYGLKDEQYKWELLELFKNRPDVHSLNFIKDLLTIKYSNLIYPVGISVIRHIANEAPEPYQKCFMKLFADDLDLVERMEEFSKTVLEVYRGLVAKLSHHHDERTMATFLTFHNPYRYALYKDSFYQKICKILNIRPAATGKKYPHYLVLLTEFIEEYIQNDNELISMVRQSLPEDTFDDSAHLLLAQDILYQTLDKQIGAPRNYWRVGSSEGHHSHWANMRELERVAIGWPNLGDLTRLNISGKKTIIEEFKKHPEYSNTANVISAKAGEILSFYQDIKQGDMVLAQEGAQILGIGIIKDEYYYNDAEEFPHERKTRWIKFNPPFKSKDGLQSTVRKISDPNTIKLVENILQDQFIEDKIQKMETKQPLNQILFGPPGTGKTYHTIEKALQILGVSIEKKSRATLRREFKDKVDEGQIVFTTFHQSMSYEDFVEGIKPETVDGQVTYAVKPGIFKSICSTAQLPNYKGLNEAYDLFIADLAEKEKVEMKTPKGKIFSVSLNSNYNLNLHTGVSQGKQGTITKDNLIRQINGENRFKDWLGYFTGFMTYLESEYHYTPLPKKEATKFVLIIDEINRGNVSQIFGELITLIEEDKRAGQPESLKIKLPYSKEDFAVPENLYIVGTMNTADRSVEALDTALRRRFSFSEMKPDPAVLRPERILWKFLWDNEEYEWGKPEYKIKEQQLMSFLGLNADQYPQVQALWDEMEEDGLNESQIGRLASLNFNGARMDLILSKINKRVEKLLDKDHLIGHSYFVNVNSINKLAETFQHNIIPLLQEYFYGDVGKIGLVLGKGFVEAIETPEEDVFADFEYITSDFQERIIYRLIDYTLPVSYEIEINGVAEKMDFLKAIQLLLA